MVQQLKRDDLARIAQVTTQPPHLARQPAVDRSFEMPTRLYVTYGGLCMGFIATMALGFGNPGLIIPLAICALFIVAFFGVPGIWTRLAPTPPVAAKSWATFEREGIHTNTGHNTAAQASVQMLILPVLLFGWGVAVILIAAMVS